MYVPNNYQQTGGGVRVHQKARPLHKNLFGGEVDIMCTDKIHPPFCAAKLVYYFGNYGTTQHDQHA